MGCNMSLMDLEWMIVLSLGRRRRLKRRLLRLRLRRGIALQFLEKDFFAHPTINSRRLS